MLNKSIKELHDLLKSGEITPEDLYNESRKNIESKEEKLNILVSEIKKDNFEDITIDNPLSGIPFTLKDNINVKGYKTTASSKVLENYVSNYDATVFKKLNSANAILVGKDNMDEFANGISTKSSYFGATINPNWPKHLVGGSSGGSAASVAAGYAKFSIGTETGGSVRLPAAWNNIVGFKPTYGLISRYGVVSFASSLDTLGIMAKTVEDVSYVFDNIAGFDENDMTNLDLVMNSSEKLNDSIDHIKVGNFANYKNLDIAEEFKDAMTDVIELFGNSKNVEIKHVNYSADIYYGVACVELFSNLNRFDGIRYSKDESLNGLAWNEVIKGTREKFSQEVKKRILVGGLLVNSDENKELLRKAKIMRHEMFNSVEKIFDDVDIVILPVTATLPPKVDEKITPERLSLTDQFTIISSLCGNPAISLPVGLNKDGLPIAVQLMAKAGNDELLLNVSHQIMKKIKGEK